MDTNWIRPALAAASRPSFKLLPDELASLTLSAHAVNWARLPPEAQWAALSAGLMSPRPSHVVLALRETGILKRWLPEIEALFGVPQLSDSPVSVDVGQHQLRVLDETARSAQPLAIRFAALMHKIGKGGTPRDIWPSHYKHEQRAQALLDALQLRMAVPPDAMALARLVADECDRIHRASDVRAGAMAAMLERLDAEGQPARFEQLLAVSTCDYAAYAGHDAASYPKAPRWRRALQAYLSVDVRELDAQAALEARAMAIAKILRAFGGFTEV